MPRLPCLLAQLLPLGAAYRGEVQANEGYGATGSASLREQQLQKLDTGGVWDTLHSDMKMGPDDRVPRKVFVDFFMEHNRGKLEKYTLEEVQASDRQYAQENKGSNQLPRHMSNEEVIKARRDAVNTLREKYSAGYEAYLEIVFDAATSMMLPREKEDIGKHCLTYAAVLADLDVFLLKPVTVDEGGEDWADFEAKGSSKTGFMLTFMKKYSPLFDFKDSYSTYLGKLFDIGTAMMPVKYTLDLQRFNLVKKLTGEFYFLKPKAADALQGISFPNDQDFESVEKNQEGRVSREAFVQFFKSLYTNQLPAQSFQQAFEEHLNTAFDAGLSMMKPAVKTTLGRHCFKYAALMAREFYFPSIEAGNELGLV